MKKKKGGRGKKREKRKLHIKAKADFFFFFFTVIIVLLFGTIDQNRDRFRRDHTLETFSRKFLRMENRLISAREFFPTCSSFLFPVYTYVFVRKGVCSRRGGRKISKQITASRARGIIRRH